MPLFSILLLLMLWALEISETMKSMETIVIHMCVRRRTRHGCFSWFCTEILLRSSLLAKTCVFHWLKAALINTCWCHFSSFRCTKHPSLSISTCSWVLLVRFFTVIWVHISFAINNHHGYPSVVFVSSPKSSLRLIHISLSESAAAREFLDSFSHQFFSTSCSFSIFHCVLENFFKARWLCYISTFWSKQYAG